MNVDKSQPAAREHGADCVKASLAQVMVEYGRHGHSAISLGRVLAQIRATLKPQKKWTAFLKSEELPFSKRKAEMLVLVHEHFNEVDAQTFAHLPVGWSILTELCSLSVSLIRDHVTMGTIHPKLTLQMAKRLTGNTKAPKEATVEQWCDRFRRRLETDCVAWRPEERATIATLLHASADALKGSAPLADGAGLPDGGVE